MLNPESESSPKINRKLVALYKTALLSSFEKEPSAMQIREQIKTFSIAEAESLTLIERGVLLQEILDEIFGFGPLGQILRDPSVREIFVSDDNNNILVRKAKMEQTVASSVRFESPEHYHKIVERILTKNDLRLSLENPIESLTLSNGTVLVFTLIEGQSVPRLRIRVCD